MSLLQEKAKKFFKDNPSVSCPAFPNEKIVFNSKGLNHLFYEGGVKKPSRPIKEVETRVNLLPSALKVLQQMPFIQEESTSVNHKGKLCTYWAFEAVVDNSRLKIIIKQIGNGKKHFWSVIPAWRKVRGGERVNAKSDLSKE